MTRCLTTASRTWKRNSRVPAAMYHTLKVTLPFKVLMQACVCSMTYYCAIFKSQTPVSTEILILLENMPWSRESETLHTQVYLILMKSLSKFPSLPFVLNCLLYGYVTFKKGLIITAATSSQRPDVWTRLPQHQMVNTIWLRCKEFSKKSSTH